MPTTPRLGLYYPVLSDDPDVPDDIRRLAVSVEAAAIGWTVGDFKFSFQASDHDQFIKCDGIPRNRAGLPAPYLALIDSIMGAHADPTKVNTPNFKRRSPMGADPGGTAINGIVPNVGAIAGEEKHLLSAAESGVNGSGSVVSAPDHAHGPGSIDINEWPLAATGGSGYRAAQQVWLDAATLSWTPAHNVFFTGATGPGGAHGHLFNARNADLSHNVVQPVLFGNWFIATGGGGTGTGGGGGGGGGFGAPIALVGGVRQNVVHNLTSNYITVQAWDATTGVQVDAEPIVVDNNTISLYSALSVNINVAIVRAV
jgi:hypothetical protein